MSSNIDAELGGGPAPAGRVAVRRGSSRAFTAVAVGPPATAAAAARAHHNTARSAESIQRPFGRMRRCVVLAAAAAAVVAVLVGCGGPCLV